MAPSTVFSYLRGQRRGSSTSNPTSPLPPSSHHSNDSPLQSAEPYRPPFSPDDRLAALDSSISPRLPQNSSTDSHDNWERQDRGGPPKRSSDSDSRPIATLTRQFPSSPLISSRPPSSTEDSPKPWGSSVFAHASSHNLAPPPSHFAREYGNHGQSKSTDRLPFYENASKAGSALSIKTATASSNQPQRTTKARLNLLNPMSLLARRRSSQTLNQNGEPVGMRVQSLTIPAIPDDYDPRIRGHGVHDFSAPRPRRNFSSNDTNLSPFDLSPARHDFQDTGRRRSENEAVHDHETKPAEHTPLFKEHFDEASSLPPDSPHYAYDVPPPEREPPPLPVFARNLPADIPASRSVQRNDRPQSDEAPVSKPLPIVPEVEFQDTSQSSTPPRASVSEKENSVGPAAIPKRLASNASRFSFDLGGVGSAVQERILEEKHKQKEAEKKLARSDSRTEFSDDGGFDYDDFDDDADLEERIPGVNVDLEEDVYEEDIPGVNVDPVQGDEYEGDIPGVNVDESVPGSLDEEQLDFGSESTIEDDIVPQRNIDEPAHKLGESTTDHDSVSQRNIDQTNHTPAESQGLEGFHFTPAIPSAVATPTSASGNSSLVHPTPRDDSGNLIGFAVSGESPTFHRSLRNDLGDTEASSVVHGLGIVSIHHEIVHQQQKKVPNAIPVMDEDDLYFDDGLIENPPADTEGGAFDENIFDDENSDLYEHRPQPSTNAHETSFSPSHVDADSDFDDVDEVFSAFNFPSTTSQAIANGANTRSHWAPPLKPHPSVQNRAFQRSGLTEGNLAAYHDALASAANEAAATGRFDRKESMSQESDSNSQTDEGVPGLVSDESRTSRGLDSLRPFSNENLNTDFEFDDDYDMDDDAIIAAANADALENDDEGFYGREFGFYARSGNNCNVEMVNGGYFGLRGDDGVTRSHSGRVNFVEPSLTPITERSEWSTRNSVISLPTLGIPHSAHTLPSPGLAQLAGMDEMDDDMTLSALLKLRRGAFGGSNGSLRSSAASQASGSPLTHFSPSNLNGPAVAAMPVTSPGVGMHVAGSTYSVNSSSGLPSANIPEESDEENSPASPTMTADNSAVDSNAFSPTTAEVSPMRKGAVRGRGHSRCSSGAESVSYVKEADTDGSGRWVLERRRTGEGGELEVIGREILTGVRI